MKRLRNWLYTILIRIAWKIEDLAQFLYIDDYTPIIWGSGWEESEVWDNPVWSVHPGFTGHCKDCNCEKPND